MYHNIFSMSAFGKPFCEKASYSVGFRNAGIYTDAFALECQPHIWAFRCNTDFAEPFLGQIKTSRGHGTRKIHPRIFGKLSSHKLDSHLYMSVGVISPAAFSARRRKDSAFVKSGQCAHGYAHKLRQFNRGNNGFFITRLQADCHLSNIFTLQPLIIGIQKAC